MRTIHFLSIVGCSASVRKCVLKFSTNWLYRNKIIRFDNRREAQFERDTAVHLFLMWDFQTIDVVIWHLVLFQFLQVMASMLYKPVVVGRVKLWSPDCVPQICVRSNWNITFIARSISAFCFMPRVFSLCASFKNARIRSKVLGKNTAFAFKLES
jgi:hypothetical protein